MEIKETYTSLKAASVCALTVAAWFLTGICSVCAQSPISPPELVAPKIEISGGNVNFHVQPSVAGRFYQLQWSETMTASTWQNVGNAASGDGNNLVISTPYPVGTPRRFYRLALGGVAPIQDAFALILAGSFTMGRTIGESDFDAPPVTVNVSSFYMSKYEVTKELWDEVRIWGAANGFTDLPEGNGSDESKGANHPVHSIDWYAIIKWCNARSQKEGLTPVYTVGGVAMKIGASVPDPNWSANGYRLPTEAEWEKAARGGATGQRFPWGDIITHSEANFTNPGGEPYQSGTVGPHPTWSNNDNGNYPYSSPVGSFAPNGYGLYDMVGNVWERCWDRYGASIYMNGATDPRGATSGRDRVFRGGGWREIAYGCRTAYRFYDDPRLEGNRFGFRLSRSSGL